MFLDTVEYNRDKQPAANNFVTTPEQATVRKTPHLTSPVCASAIK